MVLDVRKCVIKYPGTTRAAVRGISFGLQSHGIYGIAGQTGSGKSTLLSAIAGKTDVTGGALLFEGEKIEGPSKRLLPDTEKIKLVAQHPDLWYDLPVIENISRRLIAYQADFRKKKAAYLLRKAGLWHLRDQQTHLLSGGQKQLLGIISAIAEEPRLLLLDEPFSNLDHTTKQEMLDHLHEIIKALSVTTIFVSHDPLDLLGFCDHIFIFRQGKLVESGSPESLFFHPEQDYTAALFGPFSIIKSGRRRKMIRPSKLVVSPGGSISGKVMACIFRGDYYECKLQLSDGTEIYFYDYNQSYPIGKSLRLSIRKSGK